MRWTDPFENVVINERFVRFLHAFDLPDGIWPVDCGSVGRWVGRHVFYFTGAPLAKVFDPTSDDERVLGLDEHLLRRKQVQAVARLRREAAPPYR